MDKISLSVQLIPTSFVGDSRRDLRQFTCSKPASRRLIIGLRKGIQTMAYNTSTYLAQRLFKITVR